MNSYAQLLDNMMSAILKKDLSPASTLYPDKKNFPASAQLAVYVDGYRYRLQEVLENTYPALLHHLGKKEFTILALNYIEATPSRSFNIDKYPLGFAAHVSTHSKDIFAGELAQLECAIHDVYMREESPALAHDWGEKQTPESLATSPLPLRIAAQLLALTYPVDSYLAAFRAGEKPKTPKPEKHYLLVLRHNNTVQRLPLAPAEYALLSVLAENKTLSDALEDARVTPYVEEENFSASLMGWCARWIKEGALRAND